MAVSPVAQSGPANSVYATWTGSTIELPVGANLLVALAGGPEASGWLNIDRPGNPSVCRIDDGDGGWIDIPKRCGTGNGTSGHKNAGIAMLYSESIPAGARTWQFIDQYANTNEMTMLMLAFSVGSEPVIDDTYEAASNLGVLTYADLDNPSGDGVGFLALTTGVLLDSDDFDPGNPNQTILYSGALGAYYPHFVMSSLVSSTDPLRMGFSGVGGNRAIAGLMLGGFTGAGGSSRKRPQAIVLA